MRRVDDSARRGGRHVGPLRKMIVLALIMAVGASCGDGGGAEEQSRATRSEGDTDTTEEATDAVPELDVATVRSCLSEEGLTPDAEGPRYVDVFPQSGQPGQLPDRPLAGRPFTASEWEALLDVKALVLSLEDAGTTLVFVFDSNELLGGIPVPIAPPGYQYMTSSPSWVVVTEIDTRPQGGIDPVTGQALDPIPADPSDPQFGLIMGCLRAG